jgi:hypothetical protein
MTLVSHLTFQHRFMHLIGPRLKRIAVPCHDLPSNRAEGRIKPGKRMHDDIRDTTLAANLSGDVAAISSGENWLEPPVLRRHS